jgi:uncharacterized protein
MDRREFLKFTASSVLGSAIATAGPKAAARAASATASEGGEIPRRALGRTGEKVSIIGIGGHHLGRRYVEEDESVRIVRTALDAGVNLLDNC